VATLAGLILNIEEMLYGMAEIESPPEDTATAASAGATTITVGVQSLWHKDDQAEFVGTAGAVGEIVRVVADPTTTTVTVRRGQRQTTAASWAAGSVVRKNPRFPRVAIQRAIEDSIRLDMSIGRGMYRHAERTLTPVDGTNTYEMDADDFDVVYMWQVIDGEPKRIQSGLWKVIPLVDSSLSSTGRALRVFRFTDIAATVRYIAKSEITTTYADIPDEVAAIIPWFACARLVGGNRTAAFRYDPNRQGLGESQESGPSRDWRYFANAAALAVQGERARLAMLERDITDRKFVRRNDKPWLR
jgi:hypothetical protein